MVSSILNYYKLSLIEKAYNFNVTRSRMNFFFYRCSSLRLKNKFSGDIFPLKSAPSRKPIE